MIDNNLTVKKQVLLSKIQKCRDKEYEEILSMQQKGFDIMDSTKDSYNDVVNLYTCYDKLCLQPIENESDLNKLEWLFNDGKLRSNKELEEYEEYEEKESYGNSTEFYDTIYDVLDLDETFSKRLMYLVFVCTPIIPFFIQITGSSVRLMANQSTYIIFNLYCLVSFIIHVGVFSGVKTVINIILDRVMSKEFKKTNKKKPFPINTAISAASYAIFMASLFKKPKDK